MSMRMERNFKKRVAKRYPSDSCGWVKKDSDRDDYDSDAYNDAEEVGEAPGGGWC